MRQKILKVVLYLVRYHLTIPGKRQMSWTTYLGLHVREANAFCDVFQLIWRDGWMVKWRLHHQPTPKHVPYQSQYA